MTKSSTFIIVGGGLAGAKAAEALRDNDFDGHVVLFAAEEHLPYERPPLSKEYLAGKKTLDEFTVDASAWYRDHHVELRLGTTVSAVDPKAHTVTLPDESTVHYDKLLLATGSEPRRPPIPGADADGVHYLRTIDDADALNSVLAEGSSLAIVGGGWIGLEVAAGARRPRRKRHRRRNGRAAAAGRARTGGRRGVRQAAPRPRGRPATRARRSRRSPPRAVRRPACDSATGPPSTRTPFWSPSVRRRTPTSPNGRAADGPDGGVLVDSSLRTSDPDIFAVGDIASAEHPLFGTRIRTEHWANALKQPAVAAAGMLGKPAEYAELPYFFTDQYDLGMEYVGHAPDYERVVFRGDVDGREFVAFWLDGDNRVLAGMNVNVWDVLDDVKSLIRSASPVDPDRLADPQQALGSLT